VFLFPLCHGVVLFVFLEFFFLRNCALQWGKCAPGNTEEGVKGKKVRTTSDDAGGKSVSEKSKSTGGNCVSENSTGCNVITSMCWVPRGKDCESRLVSMCSGRAVKGYEFG